MIKDNLIEINNSNITVEQLLILSKERTIKYRLQFFNGDKTELPTGKKQNDARDEGQVSKSNELLIAISLLGFFLALDLFIGFVGNKFLGLFPKYYFTFDTLTKDEFTVNSITSLLFDGVIDIIIIILPFILISFILAFLGNIIQFKWKVTSKPLNPKFDKINPLNGFKNMFSKDKIMELFKAILKVTALGYVSYDTLKDSISILTDLYNMSLGQGIVLMGDIIINLGLDISYIFLAIGLADFAYQKFKFRKKLMMSKQEVKDEYKQQEGDPQVKGQIKARMREASRRRMMQQLPEADVVITNPTHFAAAIKYDKDSKKAPILVAKGADYMAQKIKEVAKENRIMIVENKPLARMLYYNVELDEEIPEELYQMTAEVLAYVYGLQNKI